MYIKHVVHGILGQAKIDENFCH